MMAFWNQLWGPLLNNGAVVRRRGPWALFTIFLLFPAVFAVAQVQGVYYSRADVLFLPPSALFEGNLLQADPAQTLSFAAVVDRRINAEQPSTAPRTTSAPLYGTGARNSHSIYIPSSGGQWQLSFSRPVITVEVVADSSEKAAATLQNLVHRISELTSLLQGEKGIPDAAQITTELSPAVPSVTYVEVRKSQAMLAVLLVGIGLAVGAASMTRRLKEVRPVRHRPGLSSVPAADGGT